METIEYRTIDKTDWGAGPWQDEPDKKQWEDRGTGLPCLIVRGPSGALCGYVGVPRGHKYHGVGYNDCSLPGAKPRGFEEGVTAETADFMQRSKAEHVVCPEGGEDSWYCDHRPDGIFRVHGGLTYSGACREANEESYNALLARLERAVAEAEKYPKGDAAQLLAEWPEEKRTYEHFREVMEQTSICHLAEPDDHVWWFGFDCAHSGDYSPKFDRDTRMLGVASFRDGTYKAIKYVEEQCAQLASQLAASS